jgi:hypothetical protein
MINLETFPDPDTEWGRSVVMAGEVEILDGKRELVDISTQSTTSQHGRRSHERFCFGNGSVDRHIISHCMLHASLL